MDAWGVWGQVHGTSYHRHCMHAIMCAEWYPGPVRLMHALSPALPLQVMGTIPLDDTYQDTKIP